MKLLLSLILWLVSRLWGINGINKLLLFSGGKTAWILKKYGAKIGKNCDIHSPLIIHNVYKDYSNLIIGEHCHIGKDVFLDIKDKINIESNVTISMRTTVITHTSMISNSTFVKKKLPYSHTKVIIKKDSYIGTGVIILEGVTIGKESIVAAGAVVTKNVPPCSIVAGIPAKPI